MLVTYNKEKCNLSSCSNDQAENFMCGYHNLIYLEDKQLKEKIYRLERIVKGNSGFKDKIIYIRNFLIHYTTGIHVPYIEHFPLETIFLYHFREVYKNADSNLNFTVEEFVSNFDFKENVYLDDIKVQKDTSSFYYPFMEFTSKKISQKNTTFFVVVWVLFLAAHITLKTLNFNIPYENIWQSFLVVLLACSTVLFSGINFMNRTKVLIHEAVSGELLRSMGDNKNFLKQTHYSIEKLKTMKENLWGIYGSLTAFSSVLIYFGYSELESITRESSIIYFAYSTVSAILTFMLIKIIWNNRYIIRLIRRIPDNTWRINLYEKEGNAGISSVIIYLQSLFTYNLFVIISLNLSFYNIKAIGIEVPLVFIILISFFFAWNYSSNFLIYRKYGSIKNEFQFEKNNELTRLKKLTSASSITKYNFVNQLKMNFFPFDKILKNIIIVVLYLLPIVASYLISKDDNEIEQVFIQICEFLKKHLLSNGFK